MALKVHYSSCPYVVVVHEAPKKAEAPNIGAKPAAPKAMALNVRDLVAVTKTAAPNSMMKCIPRIIYGVA